MTTARTTARTTAAARAAARADGRRGRGGPALARTTGRRRARRATTARRDATTGLFDDETFARATAATFEGEGEDGTARAEATTEEARALWERGWLALDVRANAEVDFEGKTPNPPRPGASAGDRVIAVPLVRASRVYDAAAGKKVYRQEAVDADAFARAVTAACGGSNDAKLMVMDDVGGCRAVRAKEILAASGFERVVIVRGGANAWKSAWDSNMRRRRLPGSFSRGFDNPMFADSNVVAEEFGASADDTVWIV